MKAPSTSSVKLGTLFKIIAVLAIAIPILALIFPHWVLFIAGCIFVLMSFISIGFLEFSKDDAIKVTGKLGGGFVCVLTGVLMLVLKFSYSFLVTSLWLSLGFAVLFMAVGGLIIYRNGKDKESVEILGNFILIVLFAVIGFILISADLPFYLP